MGQFVRLLRDIVKDRCWRRADGHIWLDFVMSGYVLGCMGLCRRVRTGRDT